MAVLVGTETPADVSAHVVANFLRPAARMQLGHQARDKTYYLISNRSVLILLEFARRYCRANDSLEVDDEYLRRIGDCILIANDLASEATTFEYSPDTSMPKETRDREFRRTYARFSTREFLFNNTDQYRYALARSILIYDLLNFRINKANQMSLNEEFELRLGFSFEDYYLTLIAIWVNWSTQGFDWKQDRTAIDPATFFGSQPRAARLNRVLSFLSQEFVCNDSIPADRDKFHKWQFQFFSLRAAPLLKYRGKLYCSSQKFISNMVWNGPYFLALDHFKTKVEKEKLFHYLGPTTETYVVDLLRHALQHRVKFQHSKAGTPFGECVIHIHRSWRAIVEVKSGRADTGLQSGSDDPAEAKKTDQMLFDGLSQLSNRIEEMRMTGFNGRITPILITGGPFPLDKVLWDHYLNKCGHLAMFADAKVHFPQVMDLESIETLCALVIAGTGLVPVTVRV